MAIVVNHIKTRDFYKLINSRFPEIGIKHKWNEDLNLFIQPNDWKKIFKTLLQNNKGTLSDMVSISYIIKNSRYM